MPLNLCRALSHEVIERNRAAKCSEMLPYSEIEMVNLG